MQTDVLTIIQLSNIALIAIWPILSLVALFKLRAKGNFTDWIRVAWALIIIVIPILGAAAFLIVTPNKQS